MKMNVKLFSALSASANTPSGGSSGPVSSQGAVPPPAGRSKTAIIAVVLVIVLIVAGLGIYLSIQKPAAKLKSGTLPSYASYSVASQGTAVTFYSGTTVASSSISSVTWNFGNGVTKTFSGSSGLSIQYTYPYPGNYLVFDKVITTSNVLYDNSLNLVPVSITPSVTSTAIANQFPAAIQVIGSSANSQNLSAGYPNVVAVGGYINISSLLPSSYGSYPITSGWSLQSMTFAIGTTSSPKFNATDIGNGVNFLNKTLSSSGIYAMTLTAVTNTSTSNSTWTFVQTAAAGSFAPRHSGTPSTHSGIVDATWIPGGFATLDPAIAYDTVSYEAIYNLYQPLVQYAPGTSASSFIPVLATTVPTLTNGLIASSTISKVTYVNYTFNLNPSAKFANGQPVTPYDVYFSVLRGLLFANDPGRPGWLLAHALIPGDSIYGPYNVSPFWVDHAMTYNSTSITFHILPTTNQSLYGVAPLNGTNSAYMSSGTSENSTTAAASGLAVPQYSSFGSAVYFMQLLTQPIGFVMDAAWANSSGAGIGAFAPNAADSSAFYNYQQYGNAASWNTKLQFGTMGSGPYIVQAVIPGQMIRFVPSQNYTQTIDYPALTAMQPSITIYYYTSESVAQVAFQTGAADFAEGAYPPSAFPQVLKMIHAGQAGAISSPQLALFTWFFVTQINVTALNSLSSTKVNFPASSLLWENASGSTTAANAPGSWQVSTFFGNLSVRRAFTYAFDQAQYVSMGTNSGISTMTNLTGYLPNGLADYPSNLSNSSSAPYYNMSLAKYYWQHSPYASAAAGSISFPIFSISGSPIQDAMIQSYWVPAIENATNNAVKPFLQDINFATLLSATAVPSAQNPLPLYFLGWIADYPDPTDFAAPFVQPFGIYSFPDGWMPGPGFNQTTNPHQWNMINAMWNASAAGAGELNAAQRAHDYYLSDLLSTKLDMIVGTFQPIGIVFYRSWITPSSLAWSTSPSAALTFLILFPVVK